MRHFAFTEQVSDCLLIAGNSFLSHHTHTTEPEEQIQSEEKKSWHNYIAEQALSTPFLLVVQWVERENRELNVEKMRKNDVARRGQLSRATGVFACPG